VTIIGSLRYQIAALTAARHAIVNRSFLSTQVSAGGGLLSQSTIVLIDSTIAPCILRDEIRRRSSLSVATICDFF
jgi:hypothetical protein